MVKPKCAKIFLWLGHLATWRKLNARSFITWTWYYRFLGFASCYCWSMHGSDKLLHCTYISASLIERVSHFSGLWKTRQCSVNITTWLYTHNPSLLRHMQETEVVCWVSEHHATPASTLVFTIWKICTHGPFHQQKRKDHTIFSYVSGAGFSLPLFMIYSRKRITETLKEDAYPGTSFNCSDNGWIMEKLYVDWFDFFLKTTPPTRPVLWLKMLSVPCFNRGHWTCV